MDYPIKIKVSKAFLTELYECEFGRFEDAQIAREKDSAADIKANDYDLVFCDFGDRHKTVIECRNDAEVIELYYACASGTIGVNGYGFTANRVLDVIRARVRELNPQIVLRFPRQDCH